MNEHSEQSPFESHEGTDAVDASADTLPVATALPEHSAFRRRRRYRIAALTTAAVVIFGAGAGGGALVATALHPSGTSTTAIGGTGGSQTFGFSGGSGSGGSSTGGSGSSGSGSSGSGSSGSGSSGSGSSGAGTFGGFGGQGGFGGGSGSSGSGSSQSGTSTGGTAATAAQTKGVVTIVSTLKYESGEAAGTGIILTSSGTILTNNHVVEGSTSIEVTDETTGKTYTATVVGTDATHDIAVLKLANASGLTTASLATTAAATGDRVTAVGNAGGTGTLSQASGAVTALDQKITTQAEGADDSEHLTNLIETSADVVSGDSGGPLLNASGAVVGIDTAASSGSADTTGYAIPISRAVSIANAILSGTTSADIVQGYPAFLGISISQSDSAASGAVVGGIITGTPAASSGLAAGDVITKVGGTAISSGDDLHTAITAHEPGDRVTVTYTDASGASRTTTVTLIQGPAA